MKKINLISIILTLFMSLNSIAETIKVSNTLDFLNAIKSDCTIVLSEGTYNISEVIDQVSNENIEWVDNFDGAGPIIKNVANLTIKGNANVTIVLEPRYAWVLSFLACSKINLEGLTIGHTEAGYCTGGVLGFEICDDITIKKCSLYGSGTVGIMTSGCNNISIISSDIYECTYALAHLYDSNNIEFKRTKFRKTGEYYLLEIFNCKEVSFVKCSFSNNFNDDFMPYFFAIDYNLYSEYKNSENIVSKSGIIKIHKCKFNNNNVAEFTNDLDKLDLKKNKFSGNSFAVPE